MVTFINAGRLGNVLFEAATSMAYAWKHGLEFSMPATTANPRSNPLYFPHLINPRFNPKLSKVQLNETRHTFQELAFNEGWRHCNIVLNGYWQTEKYFNNYRQRVIDAFALPWQPWPEVAVHVRRGDYLHLPEKHPPVPVSWIESAMAEFPGYGFIFFSDDIQWCADTFGHRDDCAFSEGQNEVQDLVGMSQCAHQICSASTFSWWASWLNRHENKRILMPRDWFVKKWGGLDTSEIVPKEWELR